MIVTFATIILHAIQFMAVIICCVMIYNLGEKLMSIVDQLADLNAATTDLANAAADEKAQVAQAISALSDTVATLQATVPPEVDLSAEIAAVKSAADNVRAIYAPPAEAPPAITADPVTDDQAPVDVPPVEVTPDTGAPSSPDDVTNSEPTPVE